MLMLRFYWFFDLLFFNFLFRFNIVQCEQGHMEQLEVINLSKKQKE